MARKGTAKSGAPKSTAGESAAATTQPAATSSTGSATAGTETKLSTGEPQNKARTSARKTAEGGAATAADLGYGEETSPEEHKRSGYNLPEHFYEVPKELEAQKDVSTSKQKREAE
jgi:hypothetical protein